MFRDMYVRSLREQATQARSASSDATAWVEAVLDGARSLTRTCPDKVWQGLTPPQRAARFMQGWSNAIAAGRYDGVLEDRDFLLAAFPRVSASERAAELTIALAQRSKYPTVNSTWGSVLMSVEQALQDGRPLTIAASQCLFKSQAVISGFENLRLGKLQADEWLSLSAFSDGVKIKGWEALRDIQRNIPYAVQIVLLIGDMDYLTVFQCQRWCATDSLNQFGDEMARRKSELQSKADAYFGPNNAVVRLWSELYGGAQFEDERGRAGDRSVWANFDGLMEPTIRMYLEQWGFSELGRREGLSAAKLRDMIIEEVTNTVAQYRLESRLLVREGAIQGWAEQVPSPSWPIAISNYDGQLEVPSLLLV